MIVKIGVWQEDLCQPKEVQPQKADMIINGKKCHMAWHFFDNIKNLTNVGWDSYLVNVDDPTTRLVAHCYSDCYNISVPQVGLYCYMLHLEMKDGSYLNVYADSGFIYILSDNGNTIERIS